jgi:o-succinylbenzoate---CoA ligase
VNKKGFFVMDSFQINYLTSDSTLKEKIESFLEDWQDENPYIKVKTSGSTGNPKIISLEKNKMLASAKMTGDFFDFKQNDKILLCLSPDTIAGKMMILRGFVHGMELFVVDATRNPLQNIDFELSFAAMVPLQIEQIELMNAGKFDLIKTILIGGATINLKLEEKLKRFKSDFYESFGMTETMSHVALRNLNDENACFKAMDHIHFTLNNQRLVIHAPKLGLDYLETNDVVELRDNYSFVWKGRADFVINSGGYKFHPELLEKKLSSSINQRFFISAEKHESYGEVIILIVEDREDENSERLYFEICKNALELYEIPKRIYFLENFSETSSAKINRVETLKKILV